MPNRYKLLLMFVILPFLAFAQTEVRVTNSNVGTGYISWTNDNTYILDELVFIEPGSKLYIEAGTVVKGASGQSLDATGLVITKGAQIYAEGTASNPIIFTAETDPLDGSVGSDASTRGLWGGVVVLGDATINDPDGVNLVEGVNEIANPQSLAEYGGTNDSDNSGVIRYVSIRHTGILVGDQQGNEIQGLTLGGVGAGTTIEYVESFASNDDGFEFFGGTVNTRFLVSAFNSDDAFDWDEGFRGKGQFWFAIQNEDETVGFGRAAEQDGATGDENFTPFAKPVIANATYIGVGTSTTFSNEGDGSQLLLFRDNTGAEYYNSLFTEQPEIGVTIEDVDGETEFDSRARLEAGDLILQNNLWWNFGAGNTIADFAPQDFVTTYLSDAANGNRVADPQLQGLNRTLGANGLDPRPASGSPALDVSAVQELNDSFFATVSFTGAFGANNWLRGWTALDAKGYLAADATPGEVRVTNNNIGTGDITWTSDNVYVLDELVFVQPGSRLFIEAGTVVKGASGQSLDATGLVVTKGAQIFAEGTSSDPIIFTAETDPLDGSVGSDASTRGLWGGVVVLGDATINDPDGVNLVEGVNEIANPQSLAEYGGTNDSDNSGVIRYVSIRHTGILVGDQQGNEIQGLTLGGVGNGTTIEFVESYASNDDGFEFFGGTVNTRYLVSAFNSDDAFDWDEGFRGQGQFWFAIQNEDETVGFGRAAEQDGATGDENFTPFARPVISNATYIGVGTSTTVSNEGDGSQLLLFRDNTGAEYYNSIFTEHPEIGITIEDVDGETEFDSRARLEAGDLILQNNLWWNFGAGNTIADFAPQDFVNTYLSDQANGNRVADPQLLGLNRTLGRGGLDPRPANGSPAKTGATSVSGGFFSSTRYVGAFDANNWLEGWTALSAKGYLGSDFVVSNEEEAVTTIPSSINLQQNYPNPFNPSTNITFELPSSQQVTLKVYDMMGREVATLIDGARQQAGSTTVSFDASRLASGVYVYRLQTPSGIMTKKMTLIK